uniref:Uncharacterized protein n=1 Tax=Oncorhynchus tshawytscha TaxID=74940 RepID=A0AAZ3PJN1_ONCTS
PRLLAWHPNNSIALAIIRSYCNTIYNLHLMCRPCPEGWESFGERCYLYTHDRLDWISSQYHCLSVGGNLAMVKSEEEQV